MNIALLLLEFQNDYFPNGRTPVDKSVEACARAEAALHLCRNKKIPVIHMQHLSTQCNAVDLFPCTKGADFYHTVQPIKGETIIKKHYPNSFKDTALLNHLIKNKINHLVVCGMMMHAAIDATVRAAFDLGFGCTVLFDACAARPLDFNHAMITAQNVHSAFLAGLQLSYASIISTDDFLQKFETKIAAVA